MKSKIFTICLVSSLLLIPFRQIKGCGFYEDESDYRAMMFRAMLPEMMNLSPFFYTMSSIYYGRNYSYPSTDPDHTEYLRNCNEWLAQCDKSVKMEDIYEIQYNTDGNLFIQAYNNNSWKDIFPQNTFIKYLTKKSNDGLLEYMLFAKKMELNQLGGSGKFENWDDNPNEYSYSNHDYNAIDSQKRELFNEALAHLAKVKSKFLKQRYAFQVCRLGFFLGDINAVEKTYNEYFKKFDPQNLMNLWSYFFWGMGVESKEEQNRMLSHVFAHSNEKKFRSVQWYNFKTPIADYYTDAEKSMTMTIFAIRNPGRALNQIDSIYALNKNNPYIPFLIFREINKLEDWIITPLFYGKYSITNDDPFQCAYVSPWEEDDNSSSEYEKMKELQASNLETDMQYLSRLKSLIKTLSSTSKNDTRDFYTMGLAHLSLLQENTADAQKYLSMVSDKANPTIRLQKNIERIWIAIKTQDINSKAFEKTFIDNITEIEKVDVSNYDNKQMLYTLTLALANEYIKKGNRVYGNLMRMKSDIYHGYSWLYEQKNDTYYLMEYFDKNATIEDMDKLMELISKKNKNAYETYLCAQPFNSINAYKDLKGTIAFRNGDLRLAYEVFASMPQNYWTGADMSYTSALNEDPFVPKGLNSQKGRSFDYVFNKTDFIKTLLDLKHKKDTQSLIKLGNAFFNVTYWGNSWLMMRYSWSINDSYFNTDCLPAWMNNYMTATVAQEYYQQALKVAKNNEDKAYINLMLHYINRLNYLSTEKKYAEMYKQKAQAYALDFAQFESTKIYKDYIYKCALIESFIENKN